MQADADFHSADEDDGTEMTTEPASTSSKSPPAKTLWLASLIGWLPSAKRTTSLQLLFAEALLLFYVLTYGQLMDAVCDMTPLFDKPHIGPAVADVYMDCSRIPLPLLFDKLNCSRFVVDGGRFPNVYPSRDVDAECCHVWALYDVCADSSGFPASVRHSWLGTTPQQSGTVGSISGPFQRHNALLSVSHSVMLLLFAGTLGLQYFEADATFVTRHGWTRFALILMIGGAHSMATVVFGGSTAPGIGICWRNVTLIRSLNAWVLISIAVAIISWLSMVRHALEDVQQQRRTRVLALSLIVPLLLGLTWVLSHYFTWHAVAKDAMQWTQKRCRTA